VHKFSISATALLLLTAAAIPAFAADNMGMSMSGPKPGAMAANTGYRFELVGPPQSAGGKSTVAVRLIHGGKPVAGAVIIQSTADMGPMGMASMTAPVKSLGEKPPGTYRFEVENGPVWKKVDNWALSFNAKVQGVAQTVTGSVTVKLAP